MKKYTSAIHVGVDKQAVESAHRAILSVMKAGKVNEQVTIEALITLRTLCQVNGTTITNSTFNMRND